MNPDYCLDDTIVAIASAAGGAARGIIRLSGPGILDCLGASFQAEPAVSLDTVRAPTAIASQMRLDGFAAPLPCQLWLWPDGRSYTGQPVGELHTLGSPPLLEAAVRTLARAGARPAEPGEFTLRAFLAGRIDLTQAEAVLGVIDAANREELEAALAQAAGGLARPLHRLREELLDLVVELEAGLDFPEEDIAFLPPEVVRQRLAKAAQAAAKLLEQMASRGQTACRLRAVLIGAPNTGKSSLFNAMVADLAAGAGALVSEQPGTTRDYLVAELDLDGVKCELIDTAGVEGIKGSGVVFTNSDEPDARAGAVETTPDPFIRQAAQAATVEQVRRRCVRLLCLDATRPLGDWEQAQLAHGPAEGQIVVWTKIDAAEGARSPYRPPIQDCLKMVPDTFCAIATSAVTGRGIAELRQAIRRAGLAAGPAAAVVPATAARCHEALESAAECLGRARDMALRQSGEELIAAEVRTALDAIGRILGAVYSEDLLRSIFSRFCVGK